VTLFQGNRHPAVQSAADYALSENGTLLYVPDDDQLSATIADSATLVWVDRSGRVVGRAISEPLGDPKQPRLSPDGTRLAIVTGPAANNELWIHDLGGRPPIRLVDEGFYTSPVWSPNGTRIAYASSRRPGEPNRPAQVYTIPSNGSVLDPEPLLRPEALSPRPEVWTQGDELLFVVGIGDIVATPAGPQGEVREVVVTQYQERDPALSPNGRWLAYASNRTGQNEIWVQGFPDGAPPQRITQNGGSAPTWAAGGRELFYLKDNAMMVVPVEAGDDFSFVADSSLFANGDYYDVASDGRFLMIQRQQRSVDNRGSFFGRIIVVQNWHEELERLAPAE
jgi:dipeptidyl aminopeptidase/acylaminoacyl peptidase